jgi:hypothetical protein
MLNSRKLYHALATVGLLALGSVNSFAQTCSGTMTTTNLGVRPEGLAELTGDINVTCASTTFLPADFTVLVQLTSGVSVTNTATSGSGAPAITLTDASPTVTTNVSYPAIANTVSLQVNGAGTAATGIRISGIRINANAAAAAGITSVNATLIITTVTGSGTTVLPLSNNPSLVATILSKSINFSVFYNTDSGTPITTGTNAGARTFPTCVSSRSVAGFFRFTENFTNVIRSVGNEGPGATTGTQLRVQLTGIPAGVGVWVPAGAFTTGNNILTVASGTTSITTQPTALQRNYLVSTATAPGTVAPNAVPIEVLYGGDYAAVDATGVVVFNVNTTNATQANPSIFAASESTLDTINIPFIINFTAGPSVGIGSATAKGTLAPVSTSATVIPRFADVGDTATAFSTAVCATTLLYPYVTTAGGFDTGLAIANTSADVAPLTTSPQSGTCVLNAFGAYDSGATVPAAGTSPTISAGRVYAISLTDSTAFANGARLGTGFTGYIIAQCNFQLAHGYAFISDYGARNLAQGYLALVLNQNSGSRTPNTSAAIESLGN